MSRSPARAASPGRKSVTGGRMDAIVGLSEDELKSFAGSGSLPIDEAELNAAFDFFDVEGRGKLTVADLKPRLSAFYKNLPVRRLHRHIGARQPAPARPASSASPQPKEYKTLINEPNFTKETLKKLLANNELGQFDPVKEAFKVYDPHGAPLAPHLSQTARLAPPAHQAHTAERPPAAGTGYVDNETLRRIFEDLGYGEITDEDLEVLVETADMDKDGRISLEDFRTMMGGSRKPEENAK